MGIWKSSYRRSISDSPCIEYYRPMYNGGILISVCIMQFVLLEQLADSVNLQLMSNQHLSTSITYNRQPMTYGEERNASIVLNLSWDKRWLT